MSARSQEVCAVEFIEGPFDGYKQVVSFPPESLNLFTAVPVNRNVVEMLQGIRPGNKCPATSVAVYELEVGTVTPRYRFVGSAKPSQFNLVDWTG